MYLHNDIKTCLAPTPDAFDQLMNLQGERYRHLEGRSTQRIQLGNKTYFIKQHRGIGWKEIVKNLSQGRLPVLGAKNEWLAIQQCAALGISVPTLFAYGERGWNPAQKESFVLMEALAPTLSLEDWCATWPLTPPAFAVKQKVIKSVAQIVKTLHANGINHRDCYLCHFLLDTSRGVQALTPDQIKLSLIDLHRAQIRRLTPVRWIIKDLSGLYFSSKDIGLTQRDYFRFMKVYSGKTLRDCLNEDNLFWQKVKARGEQLYRHHTG